MGFEHRWRGVCYVVTHPARRRQRRKQGKQHLDPKSHRSGSVWIETGTLILMKRGNLMLFSADRARL